MKKSQNSKSTQGNTEHIYPSEYYDAGVSDRAAREEATLAFWKENDLLKKTMEKDAPHGEFVFYEGPPTSNGRPGVHHIESRSFKDIIVRYKTMRGYHVPRKAGWDTHGLPVELEVEKKLELSSKKEVEAYGIAQFNQSCRESVWKYLDEWKAFTERMAYSVDLDDPYITYEPEYIESVWWVLGQIHESGRLYKDYKVLPWCTRCGTALSSHELAQGYKDVKDLSVTAEFRVTESAVDELVTDIETSIIAWTTTPWTLPGNVALAVGNDIEYVVIEKGTENGDGGKKKARFVLAKDLLEKVMGDAVYEIIKEVKGSALVGTRYTPVYPQLAEIITGDEKQKLEEHAYQVYAADFVTTQDGTGVVHTAVMYGQDDFELGTEIGLPKFHVVDQTGNFIEGMGDLTGKFVKDPETDITIIKDLAHRGLLFSKYKYEHSYPHCWRCKTPLIYYARDSWYIRMHDLRDEMLENNEHIHWEPEHVKKGRFGDWLSGARDWALSRERYWGTPLPLWMTEDGSEQVLIDSYEKLAAHTVPANNTYVTMRHGQSVSNTKHIISSKVDNDDPLTDEGKEQIATIIDEIKKHGVTKIVASPFMRTKMTAEMVADGLGMNAGDIVFDERIQEWHMDDVYEGKDWNKYVEESHKIEDWVHDAPGESEPPAVMKQRLGEFIFAMEKEYKGEKILIVTHGGVIRLLRGVAEGLHNTIPGMSAFYTKEEKLSANAEVAPLPFTPFPHDDRYQFDPHRPYIDEVELQTPEGKKLVRTPEVIDVWFDSGAMPYAQHHYPFENKEYVDTTAFPAGYISEATDQTRGWFYTLHAIGTLLGRGPAFTGCVCLGHIMAADGTKMSKSKGNTVSPWEQMARWGADTVRLWMYTVNQPGDAKNYDEKTVGEVNRKFFGMIDNMHTLYAMYADDPAIADHRTTDAYESPHVLDQWILSYIDDLADYMTRELDDLKILEAGRKLRQAVLDLSQWYMRRTRDRFKGSDIVDKRFALATTHRALMTIVRLSAPFTPLFAEDMYAKLRDDANDPISVHLSDWPTISETISKEVREKNIVAMRDVRERVSQILELRDQANMKVRQPLASASMKSWSHDEALLDLIRDEVNVKEVTINASIDAEVALDTELTDELKKEGLQREFLRQVQSMRKKASLVPDDEITLHLYNSNEDMKDFVHAMLETLQSKAGVRELRHHPNADEEKETATVKLSDELACEVCIEKV